MKLTRLFSVSFIITILILSASLPYQAVAQKGGPDFIPGQYIVVLDDGVSPQDVIRGKGIVPEFVYSHALNGFAGPLSPVAIDELKQDPRVLYIEQDQMAYASIQTLPTGIDRIDAEPESSPSSYAGLVTVAILDTGIDFDHPDLNVVHRADCEKRGGNPFQSVVCRADKGDDGHGHGTHVAGTVAALDNDIGPVGVVPGADLWAIRVLDNNGSGSYSEVIAGVDYVAANANSIDVANMSLGGGFSQALNDAVEDAIVAGVVFVVAAGNESDNAANYSPASAPSAITTSAMADFDGVGGGLNDQTIVFSSCTEDKDDSFACFSNYGSAVDIMAPGVSIFSTYKDGGYATFSGTSMASPHVAGAAAKLISENVNQSDVLSTLLANGISSGDFGYLVIDDDPDNISETLLFVGNTSVGDSPIVSITSPADNSEFHVGVDNNISFTGTASDTEDGDLTVSLSWTSNLDGPIDNGGIFSATLSEGSHTVTASVMDSHGNSASSSITVNVVNDSPTVSITSPADGSEFNSGASISFTGTASDTEDGDLTASLSWTSDIDGSIGSDGSFLKTLSDGTHTVTADVTDSAGASGSSSVTVTVGTPPENPTVSVSSIVYTPFGGKDGNKHLDITVTILDDSSNPVSGASVSVDISLGGGSFSSETGITETNGSVTFSLKNSPSGHYETDVTDVVATGFDFVDDFVDDGFDK